MNENIDNDAPSSTTVMLNCGRKVLLTFVGTTAFIFAFGWLGDNFMRILELVSRIWGFLLWLASYKGESFWFPVTGAMFAIFAFLWVACVLGNCEGRPPRFINNFTLILCFIVYQVFFWAATDGGFINSYTGKNGAEILALTFIHLPWLIIIITIAGLPLMVSTEK